MVGAVDDDSRQRLGELAVALDDLLGGDDVGSEMECLVRLADGFTGVLLHEVECARGAAGGSAGGS